ncbi:MAG TPA: hypothetical protein VFT64_04890 [Rickettsiales bacterium]|nr:hypothetical protein [Rickettsiales bacterium]
MNGYSNSLLILLAFLPSIAFAALEAPHEIAPAITAQDKSDNSGGAMDSDAGVGYEEAPPATIESAPMEKPSTDGFGTLTESSGGLPGTIWQSDNRAADEFLLQQLHTGISDPALHDLLVKLLMTQSTPPTGTSSNDWLTLRVNALAGIGEDDKANTMINALPPSLAADQLLELQISIALAHGDYDRACKQTPPSGSTSAFWKKISILCQTRAGKFDEAMVGVDMLRESSPDDPFFQDLIRHLADRNVPLKTLPRDISLLDYSLIVMAGESNRLSDRLDSMPPIAVKYLAQDTRVDAKLREKATTKAQQLGLLPPTPSSTLPSQPFAKELASDVTTLVTALGSGQPPTDADNAVIARLAVENAGVRDSRRISRLLSCMELFGYKVPDKTWNVLLNRKGRFDGEIPPAMLVDRLGQAAQAGRKGETILTAALIAGNSSADNISDLALIPIVKALKSIGFEKEARQLAYEAVKNYQ